MTGDNWLHCRLASSKQFHSPLSIFVVPYFILDMYDLDLSHSLQLTCSFLVPLFFCSRQSSVFTESKKDTWGKFLQYKTTAFVSKAFSVPGFCLFIKYTQHSFIYQILSNTEHLLSTNYYATPDIQFRFLALCQIIKIFTSIDPPWFKRWLGCETGMLQSQSLNTT